MKKYNKSNDIKFWDLSNKQFGSPLKKKNINLCTAISLNYLKKIYKKYN